MAITATWHTRRGASAGILETTAITSAVFGGLDDEALTATADPIAAGANSIRRYFVVRFTETVGTASVIDNIVIDRSDSTGSGTIIDGQDTTMDAQAGLDYAFESVVALTSITALGVSGGGTSILLTNTGASLSNSAEDSQQFAIQIDTGANAVAGNSDLILRCSFDIIA
jgi:hypothetical protein